MKDEWSAEAAAEAAVAVLEEWMPREDAFLVLDRVLVALQDGTGVYGHRVDALRQQALR